MKFVIIAAVVSLIAVVNAVDIQRQCTCDDQYRGMREFKNYATQCFDQCRIDRFQELQNLLDTPVKIYPCLDQKVDMIHRMFDCVNGRLIQEDSCTAETGGQTGGETLGQTGGQTHTEGQGQMLQYKDFRQLFVRTMQPLVDEIHSTLKQFDKNSQHKYGNILMDISDCSRSCLFNKIKQSQFWEQINCLPRVSENYLQKSIQTCFSEMNLKDTFFRICQCTVRVGVSELQPFCQQLRSIRFPQWAQSRMGGFGGMSQGTGMLDEDQDEQIGQQGQQGQQSQHPRGQRLLVKLAIQQEQPIQQQELSGFEQGSFSGGQGGMGSDQELGSTGFKQNQYQSRNQGFF